MGEVIEVVLATITTANESSLAAQGIVSAIELSRDNLTAILESTNNAQAREILDCLETAINKLKAAQEASRISAKSLGGYGAL
jgi:pyruvoyl-dependent arginine decarboxylase (PvlArgDC)